MTIITEEERTGLIAALRTDGKWLRGAKHATTEVINAGNTMLRAADEIERASTALREMREALDAIWQYGSDTLSGRADGGPDDRKWQRDAVLEMTRRARAAIEKATKP